MIMPRFSMSVPVLVIQFHLPCLFDSLVKKASPNVWSGFRILPDVSKRVFSRSGEGGLDFQLRLPPIGDKFAREKTIVSFVYFLSQRPCRVGLLGTPVACIIKIRRCKYNASVVARCFQLTNYDASIVNTTLDVRQYLWRKNYVMAFIIQATGPI